MTTERAPAPTEKASGGRAEWSWWLALLAASCVTVATLLPGTAQERSAIPRTPSAHLVGAAPLRLPGAVDSNSPVVEAMIAGRRTLVVLTSWGGQPSRAAGRALDTLGPPEPVVLDPWPGGGVWIEAVVPDEAGTWYAFYHNERESAVCRDGSGKVVPRIGMARSGDGGFTWTDLGILIGASPRTFDCGTGNAYFVGGVGDLAALLDRDRQFVYIYFSQYGRSPSQQGVAAARLAWADRDSPVGKLDVWSQGAWLPSRSRRTWMAALLSGVDPAGTRWEIPPATPIFPTPNAWHDGDETVDAFWGPALHWNSYLQQYVMLLNRAADEAFAPGGVFVSFNPRLDAPGAWSVPSRLLDGGTWYPQVVGTGPGIVSDVEAGQAARFFMGGQSDRLIRFSK